MSAGEDPSSAPPTPVSAEKATLHPPGTVIYPQGAPDRPASSAGQKQGGASLWLLGAALLAGAGAWMVLKRRGLPVALGAKAPRKLVIEETRTLGNRQYLVIAGCEGKRFLLGVTPGQIQMLTTLESERSDKS